MAATPVVAMSFDDLSGAVISSCKQYRYALWRRWGGGPSRWCVWVMLNPSRADARKNDPTLMRCIDFSVQWGFTGCYVVNLFALRSTDPKNLLTAADPVGPENDRHIVAAVAYKAGRVVLAWGNQAHKPKLRPRIAVVRELIRASLPADAQLGHLRVSKETKQPYHPLMVAAAQPFQVAS